VCLELSYGQGSYLAYPDRLPILPCLNPGRTITNPRVSRGSVGTEVGHALATNCGW
jgi:hypothetical protein